ncbi:hypothetical protein Tco_1346023 [Tanacetum coccineum]
MLVFDAVSDQVAKCTTNNLKHKELDASLTAELERYKERVKTLEQRINVDLRNRENLIDSQIDDMIRNKMHMLTKPQVFYDDTHKQALGYKNPFYLKKAQRIKPTLYDGSVISKKHDVISVVDEEETLMLAEESRLKMLAKQNDPISKQKKINTSSINYIELNKLAEDFGKCFVPQKELSAEQAFWLPISSPISKQLVVQTTPVRMKAPSELPKTKRVLIFKKKELFLENDRLLEHIICQDVMNIVMHADSVPVNVLSANHKYIVHICVNSRATLTNCAKMEQDYIDEYSENLVLKAECHTPPRRKREV